MFKIVLVMLLSCLLAPLSATAQYPDIIIIDGKELELTSNPLEQFFAKHPERRPDPEVTSTALWRGYVATFTIKDGQLTVAKIEIQRRKKNRVRPRRF